MESLGCGRTRWTSGCVALVVAIVLGVSAGPVLAQTDPYGGTTTTTEAEVSVSCAVEFQPSGAGAAATGTVEGAPPAAAMDVLLGGVSVAAVDEDGSFSFQALQDDVDSPVVVVGPTFNVECTVTAVGGAQGTPPGGGDGGSSGGGTPGSNTDVDSASDARGNGGGVLGALPFTGGPIGLLVAVALAALIVGQLIRRAGERRRRRLA